MSEQQRLQHDTAWAIAAHLVEALKFDREEQEREAFHVFYAACKAGLESYEVLKNRQELRLKPGAKLMITHKDINGALQTHKSWIDNPNGGGRPADLRGAQLRNVNLEGADFRWSDCRAADFSGSNVSKADFRHADLRGANFTGAICIGTSFVNARMDGVNLAGVDLRGAVLDYAQMPATNLHALRQVAEAARRDGGEKENRSKDREIDRDR